MTPRPLRFRPMDGDRFLAVNDAGRFFATDEAFLDRFAGDRLHAGDARFLEAEYIEDLNAGSTTMSSHG